MSSPASASRLDLPPASVPLRQDAALIGLVGLAHMVSHFSQLVLPPLFPWLKEALAVNYTQLGLLMTLFFVVSCAVQAASGFLVDRYGPTPVLFGGLALLGAAIFGLALSASYGTMAVFSVLAGVGNGVFHPVDYTLLNEGVSRQRLGHAYSWHGITGNLGWAIAPALLVPLAIAFSWRLALAAAGAIVLVVLAVLWWNRSRLAFAAAAHGSSTVRTDTGESAFAFLRIPAVWMCFAFFLFSAGTLSGIQAFAPEAARQLHDVPVAVAAMCLTAYMLCSAGGMVLGGFLAADPRRCERVAAMGYGMAAMLALLIGFGPVPAIAVPILFGAMGLSNGIAFPSRDVLVKESTPPHATGRVYGVVYAGLDVGQAIAPLAFGFMLDREQWSGVWLGLAVLQLLLIASAVNLRRVRRRTPAMA